VLFSAKTFSFPVLALTLATSLSGCKEFMDTVTSLSSFTDMGIISSSYLPSNGQVEVSKSFSFVDGSDHAITIPAGSYPKSKIDIVAQAGVYKFPWNLLVKNSIKISLGSNQGKVLVIKPSTDFTKYDFDFPYSIDVKPNDEIKIAINSVPGNHFKATGTYTRLHSEDSTQNTKNRVCSVDVGGGRTCNTAYVPGDCHDVSDGHGGSSTQCDPASLQNVCVDSPSDKVNGHQMVTFHHVTDTWAANLHLVDTVTGEGLSDIKFHGGGTEEVVDKATDCVQDPAPSNP
jgi:hypothetical protein